MTLPFILKVRIYHACREYKKQTKRKKNQRKKIKIKRRFSTSYGAAQTDPFMTSKYRESYPKAWLFNHSRGTLMLYVKQFVQRRVEGL